MEEDIKISIITPSFNQGEFIEETILSIINQEYKNIEYILIDGGSTDKTMEIVEKYRDKIDIVIHERDKGQSDAINKGFRLATGELVGWINSDDILYPDCVSSIVDLYKKNKEGVIFYCQKLDLIDRKSDVIGIIEKRIPDKNHLIYVNYDVIQQGSFYRKETVKNVGYLDEKIHYCMDLDLWLRLLEYGKIFALENKSYSGFRLWEDTKTSTGKEFFLKDIMSVLFRNGAGNFSRTIVKLRWYIIKAKVKKIIRYREK